LSSKIISRSRSVFSGNSHFIDQPLHRGIAVFIIAARHRYPSQIAEWLSMSTFRVPFLIDFNLYFDTTMLTAVGLVKPPRADLGSRSNKFSRAWLATIV
jgi:hypothetical protein